MNSRIINIIALRLSAASLSYVIWLHHNMSLAQAALRQRETELVHHFTPTMFELYRGLGVSENVQNRRKPLKNFSSLWLME